MGTAVDGHRLVHQAFVYASRDEFVAAMVPFVRQGLARGDRVLAVTRPDNVEALREALGADAAGLDVRDAGDWYRQPYRTLQAYDRYVEQHAGEGVVRVIGEPVWDGLTPAAVREWTRYESVLNAAFADAPAWIVCPYDATALPAAITDGAHRTHPGVVDADGARPCAGFRPPDRLVEALSLAASPDPPAAAPVLDLDTADPGAARRFVARQARRAGLHGDRLDELLLAVTELATNAKTHGRPPVAVHVWCEPDELVCEVRDGGPGFADRLTGYAVPPPEAPSGRGLWIVRQLCDCVDVLRDGGRFAVRVRMGLAGAAVAHA